MGIDVMRYKIVALKSSNHFRAGFQELAREIVTADPPGLTTLRVEIFPKSNKPGPLWPMDQEAQYRPGEA
jgi:microcystin degradation protein MlrC